jgi:hypothetical protein
VKQKLRITHTNKLLKSKRRVGYDAFEHGSCKVTSSFKIFFSVGKYDLALFWLCSRSVAHVAVCDSKCDDRHHKKLNFCLLML